MRILFVVGYTGDEYIGIMSISSLLKEKGYQVEVIEAEYKKVREKLKTNTPTILAYSTPTLLVNYYLKLNRRIKENFKVFSVFGGAHPTAAPEMVEEEGVDGICIGEGEFAMLELVDNLSSGRSVRNIRNWWIKENGKIFKNPLRPLINNLDNLLFVDRDLFKNQSLFSPNKMRIITGRGCPYGCSYCHNSYYNQLYKGEGAKIRKRSVENVIEEIKQLRKKFSLEFVMFVDDIFILPFNWLEEFSLKYKRYINLPFFCKVHPDLIDSQIVRYLKNAGCFSVCMGVETEDEHLRNNILSRNVSKEQIVRAAELIKNQGIKLRTSNIIGIPGGSVEIDFETIKLNIECKVDYAAASPLAFYPKAKITETVIGNNDSLFPAFSFKGPYQKRVIQNLRSLFALTVEFPFLLNMLRLLIRLPLTTLYKLFYIFWEGYCVNFRLFNFRLYPAGISNFFKGTEKYMKMLKNRVVIGLKYR